MDILSSMLRGEDAVIDITDSEVAQIAACRITLMNNDKFM